MPRAVKFSRYGGPEVLEAVQLPPPQPGRAEVSVRVVVAGVNPEQTGIRQGLFADVWPAVFAEGQGNDFAEPIAELGAGVSDFTGRSPNSARASPTSPDRSPNSTRPSPASPSATRSSTVCPAGHRPTTSSRPPHSSPPSPPTSPGRARHRCPRWA
jgi:hypothetical protein